MTPNDIERIAAWVVERGLAGSSEIDLLHGFCERCRDSGLALSSAMLVVDTLHPVHEGRVFRWRHGALVDNAVEAYGSSASGPTNADWQRSAFYHLMTSGTTEVRRRIGPPTDDDFLHFDRHRAAGETDYLALVSRFAAAGIIGELDCVYSQWTTGHADGFGDNAIAILRRLAPTLSLAVKCASLARIAETLVEVYLGRDAGQRVLAGRIARGVADRIGAVLWFSDLRGFTTISDSAAPDAIIPLLNDYAEAVIGAIHGAGGEVLKLIGDGVLAIFRIEGDAAEACRRALTAEADLRGRLRSLNQRRDAAGQPTTSVYLGLHVGDVFYGNIGSNERLDFTVIGPAVNEVNRIASMCRSVDRHVVMSSDFAAATPDAERVQLVSVGRFALRGVGRAQELFTIDPAVL
ncbi:MAG: adenylate/guanylate cyclase domain-containing protein [Reyranellaceae bacterium]